MKKIRGILALCLLCCVVFTGCQIGDKSIVVVKPLSSKYVFQIGEVSCGVKEAKLYLANYQNIYGKAYTLDLWKHDFGDESLETYIKTITLNQLVTVACMTQLAETRGLVLDAEEEANLLKAAEAYYESLAEADKSYLGVTEAEVAEYYRNYALAQKVYDYLTSEINNEEVSDDEARVMEVLQIYVTEKDTAAVVAEKLAAGEDFTSVANVYNELTTVQAYICRDDLPDDAEQIVFQLDNNEISKQIPVENGYYFIKCLNKYNAELTEANKVTIVEKREKEAFDSVYQEFIGSLSSYINEEVWETLKVDSTSNVTTNQFFELYERYCGKNI